MEKPVKDKTSLKKKFFSKTHGEIIYKRATRKIKNAMVSFFIINFLSKNHRDPLISYRLRGQYNKAAEMKEKFVNALKLQGLNPLLEGTHQEFVVYDSNYSLDQGLIPLVHLSTPLSPSFFK